MKKYVLRIGMIILLSFFGFMVNSLSNRKFKNPLDKKVCFEHKSEIRTNTIEITFLADNKVTGRKDVWIHTEEYENSSESTFEGKITGDKIKVELTIEIEDNIEHVSEIWEYKNDVLTENELKYVKVECEE